MGLDLSEEEIFVCVYVASQRHDMVRAVNRGRESKSTFLLLCQSQIARQGWMKERKGREERVREGGYRLFFLMIRRPPRNKDNQIRISGNTDGVKDMSGRQFH